MVVAYFLIPTVRNIYFDRRMRWWEIQARYRSDFRCTWVDEELASKHLGIVSNISVNGLFMKSNNLPTDRNKIEIHIPFKNNQDAHFIGEVILHDRVDFLGFGVKFHHNDKSAHVAKDIVATLEARGMRMNKSNFRPEDTFSYWVRTIVKAGQGFFLKKRRKSS